MNEVRDACNSDPWRLDQRMRNAISFTSGNIVEFGPSQIGDGFRKVPLFRSARKSRTELKSRDRRPRLFQALSSKIIQPIDCAATTACTVVGKDGICRPQPGAPPLKSPRSIGTFTEEERALGA